MTRLRRAGAVILVAFGAALVAPWPTALAAHCDNLPGHTPDWCHAPPPGPTQAPTPEPTPAPTPAPTAAPTAAPTRAPAAPVTTRRPTTTTPAPVQDVEVPAGDTGPLGTPEILVDPIGDDEQALETEDAASASSWIFGFIVGLIVGGLAGRASWGLRRKRRQQIFG